MWTPDEISRWKRHLVAMCVSAGRDDPEAFAELLKLADWLSTEGLPGAYRGLRAGGYSVREIARPTGRSHQALAERFHG